MHPAPPPVVTIGLHGSASTWVFNVVRELLIAAHGEAAVLAVYADKVEQLPAEAARAGRHLLVKSHHGSPAMDAWLAESGAQIFLSVRDPRDAALSMSQRFEAPLPAAAAWIAQDCRRMVRLAAQGHRMLRYEDRFFEQPAWAARLAVALGLDLPAAEISGIFGRYGTEATRTFAAALAELPPERLTKVGKYPMDTVTQILAPHIGDARSGKWRNLPPPLRAGLTRALLPFLEPLGYAAE